MADYTKQWLPVDGQLDMLKARGVDIGDRSEAESLLQRIGYYRLTGYLYPFRESEQYVADDGRTRVRVLDGYRGGTTLRQAADLIDFDRQLRLLVLDGIERIEVALRMRIGYVLGRRSAFAYEDPACFTEAFTAPCTDSRSPAPGRHVAWLERIHARKTDSDEAFVEHFREKYDDRMPVWALTEILELGHLSILYRGMQQQDAEEIAAAFGVPGKKLMTSWLASLNYVRNVAAHHARLFNRKLQNAPARPKAGQIALLDHLRDAEIPKGAFGTYNALAVIALLLWGIDPDTAWADRLALHLRAFPTTQAVGLDSVGVPQHWESLGLWRS